MDRKAFLKTCGYGCLIPAGLALIASCNIPTHVNGHINGGFLEFPSAAFQQQKNGTTSFRQFVIVQNDQLEYPICVYRLNENDFSALWMKCPHQGAELQAFGTKLQCPAHGSEFDQHGVVQSPPADNNLRSFKITQHNTLLKIALS